jgi:hypothetical protein
MALIIRNATGELRLDPEHQNLVITLTPLVGDPAMMALTAHDRDVLLSALKRVAR